MPTVGLLRNRGNIYIRWQNKVCVVYHIVIFFKSSSLLYLISSHSTEGLIDNMAIESIVRPTDCSADHSVQDAVTSVSDDISVPDGSGGAIQSFS
jgi:hypothetical protein